MVKNYMALEFIFINTMIYEHFSLKRNLISKVTEITLDSIVKVFIVINSNRPDQCSRDNSFSHPDSQSFLPIHDPLIWSQIERHSRVYFYKTIHISAITIIHIVNHTTLQLPVRLQICDTNWH